MKRMVLDTETTGLEPGSRLVEIYSALLNDDGSTAGEFHDLVNPGLPMPADVVATHGITMEMLEGCRSADAVLSDWLVWLLAHEVTHGIAHFASYDVGIIGWELDRAGLRMPEIEVIDTCAMAKAIKATPKNSLATLVEHYGITMRGPAHRAGGDALACRDYFLIAEKLTPVVATPWAPAYRFPKELPAHLVELPKAIVSGERFTFDYVDAKGEKTHRIIVPYGYAETDKGISFHGLCLLRNERRTFMADRVVTA